MLLSLVIKANEFGLKFILPYWGIIGFDIGFINLSNAFIDRLRVPIYHCKAPNKITTFKHKFIYSEKKIAYRNCQLFRFRLNQYSGYLSYLINNHINEYAAGGMINNAYLSRLIRERQILVEKVNRDKAVDREEAFIAYPFGNTVEQSIKRNRNAIKAMFWWFVY